jgi:uncharacterized protein DUF4199
MKRTVWTFGLIAGAIMSAMMVATMPFIDDIGFGTGEVLGYTTMVAAFLLVFFGIRSYRDSVGGGTINFGRAFLVGTLITCIAGVCYTATWEVLYYEVMPDFGTRYAQAAVDKARSQGKSEVQIAKTRAEMEKFAESYKNPLYNSAVTFLEPLPVGLIITLVSAGVLRRRRRAGDAALAAA